MNKSVVRKQMFSGLPYKLAKKFIFSLLHYRQVDGQTDKINYRVALLLKKYDLAKS